MKEAFVQYLREISLTIPLIDRIDHVISSYAIFCPEVITQIFVSEFIKEDGTREYESLWLFSETFIMEAKRFVNQDNFDITPLKNRLNYIQIEKRDYEFTETTESSRLSIHFSSRDGISGDIKGSKVNCRYLYDIFVNHILTNLKP